MLGHMKLYLTDLFNCSTTRIRLLWNYNLWNENEGLKDDSKQTYCSGFKAASTNHVSCRIDVGLVRSV